MVEPIPKTMRDVWDKWNIRGLVIFSLVLQAILVLLSPNRKRTPTTRRLFRLLLWSAYLSANWAADYAVGQISDSSGEPPEANESPKTNDLLAFWATFLLLHLGGPDTITALALEDNELWLRNLFGLLCQFVATLYVFLLSIPSSLMVPTSLMLVAGVIKYVERLRAMRGASLKRFKDLMLGEPEPGIDYDRFMEEYNTRKLSKEPTRLVRLEEPEKEKGVEAPARPEVMTHLQVVQYAYKYFNIYKGLVVDFIYSSEQWRESKHFFQSLSSEEALRILEVELSFMYGTFFTKTDILHTWIGSAFRCIALCCLFASLFIFKTLRKDGYDDFDVALTYTLLFGGIALDFISILIFCVSDWTFARLRKPKKEKDTKLDKSLNWLLGFRELKWKKCTCYKQEQFCHTVLDRVFIFRRWSEHIYAYNLIDSSLRIKPKRIHHTKGYIHRSFDYIITRLYIDHTVSIFIRVLVLTSEAVNQIRKRMNLYILSMYIKNRVKYYALCPLRLLLGFWFGIPLIINYLLEFLGVPDKVSEMVFTSQTPLTKELWEFIFEDVKHKSLLVVGSENASPIYSSRGDWTLGDMNIEFDHEKLLRFVTEVDYDQSILVWHIATEMLYQTDAACSDRCRELSKTLSDYMMYLLIVQPSLMSTVAGIDKVRFRDAIAEAKNLQEAKKLLIEF
ncbi:hypothetical protein N665_0549s0019 [Sinapis alba]|nr:hypothetical protein N665_0549s0019 [Sinapis alba]